MPVVIGTENISSVQQEVLDAYRLGMSSAQLARTLARLAHDPDLQDDENLHPDWLSIFARSREQLEQSMSSREFMLIDGFFNSLGYQDSQIETIDFSQENVAFLLGAGASKPQPTDIPTVKELLRDLLARARRLEREPVTQLVEFCEQNAITNIEDLLTAALISDFCTRNAAILDLVRFQLFREPSSPSSRRFRERRPPRTDGSSAALLQDTLQVLFGLLSNLMLPAPSNDGHAAIVKYLERNPTTPIITTNYDCCMDRALINGNVPFTYGIDFVNPQVLGPPVDHCASLIKLHGSLNWFYCETCQEVRLIDIERTVTEYVNDTGEYPIISVCNKCGGQRRGLLVPPHAMKFDVAPPLQPLIGDASVLFEQASLIVVVGFSFADADVYISRMISKAMQKSNGNRMLIIDPDPEIVSKVRRKFEVQIPQFDAMSRILGVMGDCAEVLPRLLGDQKKAPLDNDANELSDPGTSDAQTVVVV